jgi:hypothetical protein
MNSLALDLAPTKPATNATFLASFVGKRWLHEPIVILRPLFSVSSSSEPDFSENGKPEPLERLSSYVRCV